jgi:hypothetical protein
MFRIWAIAVPNATPLCGSAMRWRVVNCYRDFLGNKDRVTIVKNLRANGEYFEKVIAFDSHRHIRIGAFCNIKKELGL